MTPKAKAQQLIERFEEFADYTECNVFTQSENRLKNAKESALIMVDDILDNDNLYTELFIYYSQVKREIQNYGK